DFSSLGLGSQTATSRDAWLAELQKETGKIFEDLYNTNGRKQESMVILPHDSNNSFKFTAP
ncbi:MAG: hypothetical protein ACFN29_06450, partial [Veillonella sp.]